MSFAGGKLKLKGDLLKTKGGTKKPKKKKKQSEAGNEEGAEGEEVGRQDSTQLQETADGWKLPPKPETEDRRTEAEQKFDVMLRNREAERVKKAAKKSHRERVQEFNQYLSELSEHHDIPKVGPG